MEKHNATPEEGGCGREVLEEVHQLMHQYRSLNYRSLRDGPHDLTHMEVRTLAFFARQPGATLSDLARHAGRDKAQLTRLIKGLREKNLLETQVDPNDRRNQRLAPSAEGETLRAALDQEAGKIARHAMAGISDAEQRQLLDLLRRMARNLDGMDQ